MAVQRHNGTGWAGPARATYTLFEKSIHDGGPPIWLRARTIWHMSATGWQPTSAGYAPAADIASISARTIAKSYNDGPEIQNPTTGDPNLYWESAVQVTAGAGCQGYALWLYEVNGETGLWQYMGSYSPGEGPHAITNGSAGRNLVHWCATAWSGASPDGHSLPAGQQGFSRFAYG
jgi:hypothetical protein